MKNSDNNLSEIINKLCHGLTTQDGVSVESVHENKGG